MISSLIKNGKRASRTWKNTNPADLGCELYIHNERMDFIF